MLARLAFNDWVLLGCSAFVALLWFVVIPWLFHLESKGGIIGKDRQ